MRLTEEEKQIFEDILRDYLSDEKVQKMKEFSQHGTVTTYHHCYAVALMALWINRRWKLGAREEILLPGALMHDMFLYDWHTIGKRNPHHAVNHATLAGRNAVRYLKVSDEVHDVIYCHMWPVNITRVPKNREGWIVCMADKWVSLRETVTMRKGMRSLREELAQKRK